MISLNYLIAELPKYTFKKIFLGVMVVFEGKADNKLLF